MVNPAIIFCIFLLLNIFVLTFDYGYDNFFKKQTHHITVSVSSIPRIYDLIATYDSTGGLKISKIHRTRYGELKKNSFDINLHNANEEFILFFRDSGGNFLGGDFKTSVSQLTRSNTLNKTIEAFDNCYIIITKNDES